MGGAIDQTHTQAVGATTFSNTDQQTTSLLLVRLGRVGSGKEMHPPDLPEAGFPHMLPFDVL